VDIRPIDRGDEALIRRWWEVSQRADALGRPWTAFPTWPAARAAITVPNESVRHVLLAAFDGDDVVGTGEIVLPLLDNTHQGYAEVWTRPDRQRRGIGSAVLAAAEEVLRASDRRTVVIEASQPLGGQESSAVGFLRHHGFEVAITDEHRVLDLPGTQDRWPVLEDETRPFHADYRLVTWWDAVPEEHLEGFCRLQEAFNHLAPAGDLELEAEKWDADRVRSRDERFRRAGRRETVTAAVAPDGSLVALTEVMVSDHAPDRALQGGTLVLEDHRGHRLGMAVKVANQRMLRRRFPKCRLVHTWNADVNEQMNAINRRLGFETVELLHEMQRAVR
jgi:GNAT superfamily N-acetyltransferase